MNQLRKKVLIIAYVFPPIAYVGTYRTLRFCRYLPENGWEPHVLTIREAEDLDNDYKLLARLPGEVKIYRTRTIDFWRMWRKKSVSKQTATNKKSIKSNSQQQVDSNTIKKKSVKDVIKNFIWALVTTPDHMVFWIPFAVFRGIKVMRKERCDVIYTTSPPHSEHVIGYFLKKIFRKRWAADFRDPIMDSSGYSPSRFRYLVDRALEKMVVRNADTIIIISDDYLEKIKDRHPWASEKFVVLPNGYDPEVYSSAPVRHFDKFTIIYTGSFYSNIKPDFFIRGFKEWLVRYPEIRGQVQVNIFGIKSVEAKRIIDAEELQDVVELKGRIPQDELIPQQKGADLLLLIIGFQPESRGTVTSKVFEYMACNRPILAIMPDGNAAEILNNYDRLYWVRQEKESLLVEALNAAFHDYHQGRFNPTEESIEVTSLYDARRQTKTLASFLSC